MSSALALSTRQDAVEAAVRRNRHLADEGTRPAFLADVPGGLGLAFVNTDGHRWSAGDADFPFSLQSITKLFALAALLMHEGEEVVWRIVGYGHSDRPYYAFGDLDTAGLPANPFVNAGALLITDRLHAITGGAAEAVRNFIAHESGNPEVHVDPAVAEAELSRSHRNTALAHALAGADLLTHAPEVVLEQYVRQCAITASCTDTARAARFLARAGLGADGTRMLDAITARRVNGLLTIAGTYAASARTLFRIGLPAKSGVGGGLLAVAPGAGTACAWSPGLDADGNSIGAAAALETFVELPALR